MNEEQMILGELARAASEARPLVLATVISTRGSVPRHAGSKMIIDPARGTMIGTIGGGCGEADVIVAARDVASSGIPQCVHVELMDSIDSFSPAVCGGVMDVFVERVTGTGMGTGTGTGTGMGMGMGTGEGGGSGAGES